MEKLDKVAAGDLISRSKLLAKMFPYGMPDNGNYGINARAVRDAVVGAPVVEAEPVVHGRWELYPNSMYRRCSVCKMEYDRPKFNVRANFCPNCGAHMDEK